MLQALKKIFGSKSDKDVKLLLPIVDEINAHFAPLASLTDEQLKAKTDEFRAQIQIVVQELVAEQQQIQERERQLAYERGRLEAMRARAALDSDSEQAYNGYMSAQHERRASRELKRPSLQEWSREYGSFLDNFSNLSGNPNELNSLDIWFTHAPNIYGQLYTFPRPSAM